MGNAMAVMSVDTLVDTMFVFGVFVGLFVATFVGWLLGRIRNDKLEHIERVLRERLEDKKGGAV